MADSRQLRRVDGRRKLQRSLREPSVDAIDELRADRMAAVGAWRRRSASVSEAFTANCSVLFAASIVVPAWQSVRHGA